jgi:hypothetical protein
MMDENTQQLLEDYLANRLSGSDIVSIEAEINNIPAVKAEYEKLLLLKNTIQRQQTRDKIKAIHAQKMAEWKDEDSENEERKIISLQPKKNNISTFFKIGGMVAAACAVFMIYLSVSPISMPDATNLSERGNSSELDSLQKLEFGYYLQGQKALSEGKNEEAIVLFQKVMEAKNIRPYYKDAALWFSAVANSELGNDAKVNEILKQIDSRNDFRYEISRMDRLKIWWKGLGD